MDIDFDAIIDRECPTPIHWPQTRRHILSQISAVRARVGGERDSLAKSIMSACTGSGCLNAHELRAALDRTHKRATNAEAEVKRLGRVVDDYAAQIREHLEREKAAEATHGRPMAWAVFLPKGDEYDYAVFPHVEDAKQHAEILDADEEDETEPRGVIPLYGDPSKALALLRAECEAWRKWRMEFSHPTTVTVVDDRSFRERCKVLRNARAATDAAGILKGVGT